MFRCPVAFRFVIAVLVGTAGLRATDVSAGRIEAVQGKRYALSRKHGPWMIMVASFQDIPEKKIEVDGGQAKVVPNPDYVPGTTAYDAADQLVYELRSYGIPAYAYEQKAEYDQTTTVDRLQRVRNRTYAAKKRNIAVLAGNYKSARDNTAQTTLGLVKRFSPRFLVEGDASQNGYTTHSATGAAFRPTPGQPTPLSGAFLTMNPLLTASEANELSGERNPLLARLNSGNEYTLANSKGKFTIQIATFYGRSTAHRFGGRPNAKFFKSDGSSLDQAAESAWQVARHMRAKGTKAFVHHEQFRSFVTIGEFDTVDDPRIPQVVQYFAPKQVRDPKTNAMVTKFEFISIPGAGPGGTAATYPIDPQPLLIEMPRF